MERNEITALFAKRHEILARRDARELAALHTEDGILESAMAGTLSGRAAIEQFYRSLFSSFPDFTFETGELLIDGNRVVQTATFCGTDRGGFMGLAATGKHMRINGVFFYTLRDGQIARMRSVYDFTGLLVQVGVLKVKPM
jgi:steroid delta-isomerase-like uncharacterized protein